ncbi:LOW QUALITY PROTEIN: F-box protein PP2-B10-like [Juglans microcarpa x Juglans regia]|uniref:LOW QUALITY PROTEIN: F-box protein PP2-B10-like n=1 Tax=Juglans microcarpa x Juglans regia TaxID=2249226 RepID=UPI001B7EDABF|nr:LOW QUALITY PROTEIN: F-box protein PP2-B10-like [Juglans microcarpa x Juglans regia]
MDIARTLPEECIANIISGTSPGDACRLSLVSRAFESAATSNLVWERFLPPDYQEIISSSSSSSSSLNLLTKKNLYFHLCDNPILIGNSNNMSFQIDKHNGKKCLMLAARELSIIWGSGDTPHYWEWISSTQSPVLPKSRFSELAHLRNVCWLDIKSRIETKILSPKTKYVAYFIYFMVDGFYGFNLPVKVSIRLENEVEGGDATNAYLNPRMRSGTDNRQRSNEELLQINRQDGRLPIKREDRWMEIEIGEFFNGSQVDDHGAVEMCLKEVQVLNWKFGLVVHGIELRPKEES